LDIIDGIGEQLRQQQERPWVNASQIAHFPHVLLLSREKYFLKYGFLGLSRGLSFC